MSAVESPRESRTGRILPPVEVSEVRVSHSNCTGLSASSRRWIASGIFLVVLGVYILTSPGRIDIIDGQTRFDVTYNWITEGRPIVRDNWIGSYMGVPGRDGFLYSYYGAPGSIFALPLVWLGLHFSAPAIQPSQFLFSMTSSILGAGIAPILFLFYLELGVTARKALMWTLVSSFASYIWPISNSTFDNAQHAFFALAALYFGFLSARRKSAAYAVIGGLMAAVLVLYQEYFLLIVPALGISTLAWEFDRVPGPGQSTERGSIVSRMLLSVKCGLDSSWRLLREAWAGPGEARSSCVRYLLFSAATSVGVVLALLYNNLRFGSYLDDGKIRSIAAHAYPLFGNPLAGLLTLLVSPGKSIFLYSPPLALALWGTLSLWRQHREIALATLLASLALVSFLSCICFVGGDWCWGPRYLAPLLPLWALGFPFLQKKSFRRELVMMVVGAGLLIQVMALSVENQRYFFERGFRDYFWAEDPWVYFKHSALFARVGEVVSLNQGLPQSARWFNSIPIPEWSTYTILGPPAGAPRYLAPLWMHQFKVFFLPRPWPLWMSWLPSSLRPVNPTIWALSLLCVALLGVGAICRGYRESEYV